MIADRIARAAKNNISDSNSAEDKTSAKSKNSGLIATKVTPIPLIHARPLYLVMHPDVRRSARIRVVSEWLGEFMHEINRD